MESYIPEKHIWFCCKDNLVWIQACYYRSQKKNDSMHGFKVVILSHAPHHVAKDVCSCIAGSTGMCSHIIGLLKQLIHYVLMKLHCVPVDLTCTQIQQSWYKLWPTEIELALVMSIACCKAKQSISQVK